MKMQSFQPPFIAPSLCYALAVRDGSGGGRLVHNEKVYAFGRHDEPTPQRTKFPPPDAYTVLPAVRLVYDELKYETVTKNYLTRSV